MSANNERMATSFKTDTTNDSRQDSASFSRPSQDSQHPRVRFSTDFNRQPLPSPRRPVTSGLTVDTSQTAVAAAPGAAVRSPQEPAGGLASARQPQGTLAHLSPRSPISPRKRNRGYSLRRQLFFRNAQEQVDTSSVLPIAHSSANDILELASLGPSPSPKLKKPDVVLDGNDHDHPQRIGVSRRDVFSRYYALATAHYRSLIHRAEPYWSNVKKTILRTHELPPSKDGRKIPLRPGRQQALIDERTGNTYVPNTIRSSRYTLWNFLPKQLFAQFSKLANFYFLCVSILQMIPTLSTTGTYTTIVPLLIFITIAICREGYDDYRRYKLDKKENNRDAKIFRLEDTQSNLNGHWAETKWKELSVGDIVRLERDDWVPADLLLLHSEGAAGIAYVETMALDGETNLKSKQALPMFKCATDGELAALIAEVTVEDPNLDLYNFEGKVMMGGETKPLSNSQVVYRGSILRNTPSMVGMVIFTGEENKIRMNANKNPRTKAPALQTIVNKIVIFIVILVILLAIFNTIAYQIWRPTTENHSWYLEDSSVAFFPIFASYVIMFNTMIPLSLYVSLEIIKVFQMLLFNDIDMYDPVTNTPFVARTATINEDCGQISYIFSDKTGTLTENSMLFRKMSVAGHAWLHNLDVQENNHGSRVRIKRKKQKGKGKKKRDLKRADTDALNLHGDMPDKQMTRKSHGDLERPGKVHEAHAKRSVDGLLNKQLSSSSLRWRSSANPSRPQPELSTVDLLQYLQNHPHTFFSRKARFFLLSLALAHTCLPEPDGNYQSSSPDELALVKAAQELGYICSERNVNTIKITSFPNGLDGEPMVEEYEILETIEFSSKRKRMSIVTRFPSGKICVLCKGADTTIRDLLKLKELASQKQSEVQRRSSIRKSLEAQEIIRRNSMQRTSSGGRSSFAGPSRPSFTASRLMPIQDEFDTWLKQKDGDVDLSSVDDDSIYSRPSGQFATRHSIAFGDVPNSPLEREMDEDIVEENLALDNGKVFERCFAHIDDFASEGLRTLLYAHRFIEEPEYLTWKRIYTEAATSLVDREASIEKAAESIERDFELTGATAIEDKLQQGVPETIDKLRRAGIKLWMLTGDKRETAINIGHSCRLIKDYSTITILDHDDPELVRKMKAVIFDITAGRVAHSVVVVDGGTLATIEEDESLMAAFFETAVLTDSVICCRASPSQKASLVKTIRTKVRSSVTLAIGDGANDIAMIQEAHVGVGITGKEGMQAARVSDYSMAQFRFLLKFLLVHGRWNYIRVCKYTLGTFWKEFLFYLTQAVHQTFVGWSGSSLYESWSLSMFNTLFTSLPVIFLGIFMKDLNAATLLAVPELYKKGQQNAGFNFVLYLGWMFLATSQAMIVYFMMHTLYAPSVTVDQGVYAMGTLTFTVCVTVICVKLQLIETYNKSIMTLICCIITIGGWYLWNIILCQTYSNNIIFNVKGGLFRRFGNEWSWWLVYIFSVAACLILDISFIAIRIAFMPTDVDTFQEIEQSPEMRKSLEDSVKEFLQQGWGSNTTEKEDGQDAKRECEVVEMLRPRDLEQELRGSDMQEEDISDIVARQFGSIKRP